MTPVFALWLALPIKRAIGTSLSIIPFLALSAVLTETLLKPNVIHYDLGAALALGSAIGARIGFHTLTRLSDKRLKRAFAFFLLFGAFQMTRVLPFEGLALLPVPAFALVGVLAGIIAALFGVGGGILAVPLLLVLRSDLTFVEARATSLVMIVVVSSVTTALFARERLIERPVFRAVLPGAMLGAATGIPLAHTLPETPLRLAFAGLLIFSAWRLSR